MAELLKRYLAQTEMSEEKLGEDLENSQWEMVKGILSTLNELDSHEARQKMFNDQLWGLILMSHFKVAKKLTKNEVQLYLLRQEKSGPRSRTQAANKKREDRNKKIQELLFQCFQDWVKSGEGKDVVDDDDDNDDDNLIGKTRKGIIMTLAKEKALNEKQINDLVQFDNMFMAKAGTLLVLVFYVVT